MNFGPQTKKVIGENVDLPKWTFSGNCVFQPLGGASAISPQIFTHDTTPKLYFQSDLRRRAA